MDTFKLVKELLYLWVEKIVENLEKLTTDKQKQNEEQKVMEETKEQLPPVVVEQIHTMPPVKEEEDIKIISGEVWYKVKKMVEIPKKKRKSVGMKIVSEIKENKEKKKTAKQIWRENNKDKIREYAHNYYERNKVRLREQNQKNYFKKREEEKQKQKELEQKFNDLGRFNLLP